MLDTNEFSKNSFQSQPKSNPTNGDSQPTGDTPAATGGASGNNTSAGSNLGLGGNQVGSNQFVDMGELGFGSVEIDFPVADKAITKYVEADFIPTDDYLAGQNFPQGASIVGSSENKSLEAAKITSDRVEPIAVFSQRALDFSGIKSPAYSAAYQAFVEDRISRAFSEALFASVSDSQPDLFSSLDATIDTSLERAQSIIDAINSIFLNIRKFENTFHGNNENIKSICNQLFPGIADPEPLLNSSPIFDSPLMLFVREYAASMGKSAASSVFTKMTQTAQMAVNLAIAQSYFERGCSHSVLEINYPFQGSVNPFGVFLPATRKQANYPTEASDYPSPDIRKLAGLVQAVGTPMDSTDLELGNYRYSKTFDSFYRNEIRMNRSRMDAAVILSTIVANEFCVSAGLGRLVNTPTGNQFGADSNFAKSLFGINAAGDITKIASPIGSLADHLTVTVEGNATTTAGTEKIVLPFDGARHENKTRKGVTTCTTAFAKGVLKNSSENKMAGFKKAIFENQNRAQAAMDFYVKVHNRDKDLVLLTPRGLFTRVLEEVHVSLQEGALGFDLMNRKKVGELSFYNIFGNTTPYSVQADKERLRAIFYTALCRQGFKAIQPESAFEGIDISDSDAKLDHKKIRFARKDMVRAGVPYPRPVLSMMAARRIFGLLPEEALEQGFRQIPYDLDELYDYIYSPGSLTARLANVFSELHSEAEEVAASDGGDAGIVGTDRYTRASRLDAANLCAMIFEIASLCVSTFFESKIVIPSMGEYTFAKDLFMTVINKGGSPKQAMENIENNTGNAGLTKGKGFFAIKSGPDSKNAFCASALEQLINASKTDDFDSLYNAENVIPNLGGLQPNENIASDNVDVMSFLQLQQKFETLAVERDVPYASLLAHLSLVEYTAQNTESLVNISDQILGLKERSNTIQRYVDFTSTESGKKYTASANDVTVETSQRRLDLISKQKKSPIKRLPRLTLGELSCMKNVLSFFSDMGSDSLMLVNIGLPNEMLENVIYPRFKTEAGFEEPIDRCTLRVSLKGYNAFKPAGVASNPLSKTFLPKEVLSSDSFSFFETSAPPTTIDEIVDNMVLSSGITGKSFISAAANSVFAREILQNELFSYMARKFTSIISPVDLFVETSKADSHSGRVDSGAASLARTFATSANLSESAFDNIFVDDETGKTQFSKKNLISKTVSPGSDKFGNVIARELDFATADMFADIFGSLAFSSSTIEEGVFAETHYEKICCLVVTPDMFVEMDEDLDDIVVEGKLESSSDPYVTHLQTDLSQGTIRMNTYEASISVGDLLFPK